MTMTIDQKIAKLEAELKKSNARVKKLEGSSDKASRSTTGPAAKKLGSAVASAGRAGAEGLSGLASPLDTIKSGLQAASDSALELQAQFQSFFQAGYTGQMFSFSKAISTANKTSLDMFGTLKAGRAAITGLREGTMTLALANADFTKSLVETGTALAGSGWHMGKFAEIIDSATFAYNKSEGQVEKLMGTLIEVQRQIPVSGQTLATNFRFAQKNFAYSSKKMMENFIGLQKMSTTTGVSFQGLTTAFGSSMDTFQGSAEKAGKLNQILGRGAFNSMEMLTMTETERATKIRNAIMSSGRSIEDMGKFELIALQKTIGLGSIEDTRKFLRGDLKIDKSKSLKAIKSQDPSNIMKAELKTSLGFLKEGIRKSMPVMSRYHLDLQALGRANFKLALQTDKSTKKLYDLGFTTDQVIARIQERISGQAKAGLDPTSVSGLATGKTKFTGPLVDPKIRPEIKVAIAAAFGKFQKTGLGLAQGADALTKVLEKLTTVIQKSMPASTAPPAAQGGTGSPMLDNFWTQLVEKP